MLPASDVAFLWSRSIDGSPSRTVYSKFSAVVPLPDTNRALRFVFMWSSGGLSASTYTLALNTTVTPTV